MLYVVYVDKNCLKCQVCKGETVEIILQKYFRVMEDIDEVIFCGIICGVLIIENVS